MKMKTEFMIIIGIFLIIAFIVCIHYAGYWLITKDQLEKVDAIVVISGDQGERVRHGAKLFENNYADYMIISGCPGTGSLSCAIPMRDQAVELGVLPEKITLDILKDHSSGTGTQAINVKSIMLKKYFKSAILVTSNYHTRRARLIFNRAFKKSNLKLLMAYPDKNVFNPKGWWKRKHDRRIGVFELVKFVLYWFK